MSGLAFQSASAPFTEAGVNYHLRVGPDDNPLSGASHGHAAVNLPTRDGAITHMELLHTPDVFTKGISARPAVLRSWKAEQ